MVFTAPFYRDVGGNTPREYAFSETSTIRWLSVGSALPYARVLGTIHPLHQENGYGWTFTEREGHLAHTGLRAPAFQYCG